MVYLALYELMGWSAVCTCSARAIVLYLLFFYRPYRPNEGHRRPQNCRSQVYYPNLCFFSLPFLWGTGGARQDQKTFFERGPPVLGNFGLATPNLVHRWSSMCVIRWHIAFYDEVRSPPAQHVHYSHAQAPSLSGNIEGATRNLVYLLIQFNECSLMVHDLECCGALCSARACCKASDFGKVHKAEGCKMADLTNGPSAIFPSANYGQLADI